MSLGATKELKKSALLSLIMCYQILVLGYQGDNTIREELEMKSETFDSENKEKVLIVEETAIETLTSTAMHS